jgi:polar amino acid transport system substrate-binding protein
VIVRAGLALALLGGCATGVDPSLAPAGTLRAVFIGSNPVQGAIDAKTGEARGPAPEIAQALARRIGVPLRIAGANGAAGVIDAMRKGEADVGFLAFDPARAEELDFSRSYLIAHNSYLVLASSPLRSVADADRPGVKIGVAARDAADLHLSRTLKSAQLVRNPGGDLAKAVAMLRSGEIDAYGANRQRLTETVAGTAGLRILPDNFYGVEQAVVVAKGNRALLAIVNQTLDEARASGLVARAIARAGLAGVDVAP